MPGTEKNSNTSPNTFRDELQWACDKYGPLVSTGIAASMIGVSPQALSQIMMRRRLTYVIVRTPEQRTHNLIPLSTCVEIINERKTRIRYLSGRGTGPVDKPPKGGSVRASDAPASNARCRRIGQKK